MSQTSAYSVRIRTGSADSNGIMLLDEGELVAILIELADESHGQDRDCASLPVFFDCADDAYDAADGGLQ